MSTGRIVVVLSTNRQAQPITSASIVISDSITNRVVSRLTVKANSGGRTDPISVDAPDISLSLIPETATLPYAIYNIAINAEGYYSTTIRGVQVFAERTAVMEAVLVALPKGQAPTSAGFVDIPTHNLFSPTIPFGRQEYDNSSKVISKVVIPKYVTVHLGRPNEAARNVTVSFPDYIKNVCCSEIYSTWPTEALKANIYAQISLVLNRIYTEWYRSRGYPYDITNSTAYDQYFVYGRNIDANISDLVDGMFNMYVRKIGTQNPYYTEYCDGSSVSCPGMKQWGTVTLANNGYTALQILQYYYGNDIEIVKAESIDGIPSSYPGEALRLGSSGAYVLTIQRQLARIAKNYPSIGTVNVDGIFGASTEAAVRRFQEIFSLSADGVVGESTWYKISYIFVAVTKLAELASEGVRYDNEGIYPGIPLRIGSQGAEVSSLQYYISVIANAVEYIPTVAVDGIFGASTEYAIRQIQSLYDLVVDGVVGKSTWDTIYNAYKGIIANAQRSDADDYPGTPLKRGSSGTDVTTMQKYLSEISQIYARIPDIVADGKFGAKTENSVRAFQSEFGLTVDGIIGEETWYMIVNVGKNLELNKYPGILRVGSSGDNVTKLQNMLNFTGKTYSSIPAVSVDGIFGQNTRTAVVEFQELFDLNADGIVGRVTWNKLLSVYLVLLYSPLAADVNVYPGYPLSVGSSGDSVSVIQSYINYISKIYTSIPAITADGIFGRNTENSVKELQRIFSVTPDGIVNERTWNLTVELYTDLSKNEYSGNPLRIGSVGDRVQTVQNYLNYIGRTVSAIPPLTADGVFGNATYNAVIAFQKAFGLSADGIVGKNTWNAILREYNILYYTNDDGSEVYPGTPLTIGSSGSSVSLMQKYLNFIAGFYKEIPTLNVDSSYGNATASAVTAFQQLFFESSDGVIGNDTWNMIIRVYKALSENRYGGTTLKEGSSGDSVTSLQSMLNTVRSVYPSVPELSVDGVFGRNTKNAVITFQRIFGISDDGVVGTVTWNTLLKENVLIMNTQQLSSKAIDAYPGTPLSLGCEGDDVAKMQNYLNVIKYYYPSMEVCTESGKFNEQTERCVTEFQKQFFLPCDGIIEECTWNRIVEVKNGVCCDRFDGVNLQYGSSGEQVKKLQRHLNTVAKLYLPTPLLDVDGKFGYGTKSAVQNYQTGKGLTADGIVGKKTWDSLISDSYTAYYIEGDDEYPGVELMLGSQGNDVKKMQNYLNVASETYSILDRLSADGKFGVSTENDTEKFQKLFGLEADGIIGKESWQMIVDVKRGLEADRYNGVALQVGSSGPEVKKMQTYLNVLSEKYPAITYCEPDGRFGANTKQALTVFQRILGLSADGIAGKNTWKTLIGEYYLYYFNKESGSTDPYPGTALKIGSSGANVLKMQKYLNEISDYYVSIKKLAEDGKFGSGTQSSVISFQKLFGLSPDGIIGKNTWNKIVEVKNSLQNKEKSETSSASVSVMSFADDFELSLGAKGEDVIEYQKLINRLADTYNGIRKVDENGVFDTKTAETTAAVQKLLGLEVTGRANIEFTDNLKKL